MSAALAIAKKVFRITATHLKAFPRVKAIMKAIARKSLCISTFTTGMNTTKTGIEKSAPFAENILK